jgi:plasmid maintenance system antidote protein VapI
MSAEFWMNLQSSFDLESARFAIDESVITSIKPAPLDPKTGSLKAIAA